MKLWQIDSFTDSPFSGNPAAVVYSEQELSPSYMQSFAEEMNLSETAYLYPTKEGLSLRWFTPKSEIDLCGHATLAAAHVYFNYLSSKGNKVHFVTQQVGTLEVRKKTQSEYEMDFPSRLGKKIDAQNLPPNLLKGLRAPQPVDIYQARDLMLVFESEEIVRNMRPNFSLLENIDPWIIVTAPSQEFDFISRFFCAGDGINEDPVTGSAHCTLAPYWSEKLQKKQLEAFQASARGGRLKLIVEEELIKIKGSALTVFEGTIV